MTSRTPDILPRDASDTLHAMADAALQAGAVLLAASTKRHDLTITEKTAGDFVSEADHLAEAEIFRSLDRHYPGYGWLGEETGTKPGRKGQLRWIVDPLDGTVNFLKGIPHWAISIALYDGDDPLCGLIYDPVKSETFAAERGKGAHLNGRPIKANTGVAWQAALFATGVPAGERVNYLPHCLSELEQLMPKCAGIRRAGAAALDLAYVAAGRLDGYWERNLGAWDVAAGTLLVSEAGGYVAPLWPDRDILSSGSFVTCNADLASALVAQLRSDP